MKVLTHKWLTEIMYLLTQITLKKNSVVSALSLSQLSFLLNLTQSLVKEEEDKKEKIAQMFREDDTVITHEVTKLKQCIQELETVSQKQTQHVDEKLTFLTVAESSLNEIILL